MGSFRSRPIPVLIDGRHLAGAGSTRGFGRYLRSLLPELAQLPDVTVSVLMTAPAVHAVPNGISAITIQRGLPLPARFGDLEHHVRLPLDVARHRQGVF